MKNQLQIPQEKQTLYVVLFAFFMIMGIDFYMEYRIMAIVNALVSAFTGYYLTIYFKKPKKEQGNIFG